MMKNRRETDRTGGILKQLGKLVKELGSAIRSNVWFLEGSEANTGKSLRILFAGGDKQKDYIAGLVFDGACRETSAGKLYFWNILYLIHRNSNYFALAFIEGRRLHQLLYQGAKDYYIPLWLESCVELPLKATTKGAKEDLRRIRKHQLTYELSTDLEALQDFYNNMYLATIHARHEKSAVSSSFEEFSGVVSSSDNKLLLVKHGETAIAGVVLQMTAVPRLWIAGIRDSSNTYRRMGAVGATYHFPAQYLTEQGYRQMSLGRSRSFFNDGVLQYKAKWNHHLSGFDKDGMVVKMLTASDALLGFLGNQPFACVEHGELHATVFIDASNQSNERKLKEIDALRSLQGLAGVSVFSLDRKQCEFQKLNQ